MMYHICRNSTWYNVYNKATTTAYTKLFQIFECACYNSGAIGRYLENTKLIMKYKGEWL